MVGVVVLEPSNHYKFVETGPDGEVEHLNPSLVGGEKHHVISVSILIIDIPDKQNLHS